MNPDSIPPVPGLPPSAPHVRIVGVGGAGSRLALALSLQDAAVSAMAIDTDSWALRRLDPIPTIAVGEVVLRGLGCGGDAVQGAHVAEVDQARLKERLSGAGLLVLVVGLGGGAGSGIAPVLARLGRETGAVVVALATVPFRFEGPLRAANARQGLAALRRVADLVIPVSHQGLMRTAAESTRAEDLLRSADEYVLGLARELLRMLSGQALIPLGIADLARVFRGRQMEGGAASAEASGEHRAREVWERLSAHPLLVPPSEMDQAGAIVLQVSGGADLKLEEIEWLEQMIQRSAPRAQVLLGAVTQPSLEGRLAAMLVVATEPVSRPSGSDSGGDAAGLAAPPAVRHHALVFEDLISPTESAQGGGAEGHTDRPGPVSGRGRSGVRTLQQQFDFAPRWRGRFEGAEGTLRGGENLDEPTFARRGVKLN